MIEDQKAAFEELADAAGFEIEPLGSKGFVEGALFRLLKGRLLDNSGALLPGSSIHELGGAGMGDDPKRFVLSRYNKCWDVPNLFVTDGACFVSAGCQNPTLTIMALTVRACEYIACQLRAGEL
jgi:choline dehydrogenase-like flavoprotein